MRCAWWDFGVYGEFVLYLEETLGKFWRKYLEADWFRMKNGENGENFGKNGQFEVKFHIFQVDCVKLGEC